MQHPSIFDVGYYVRDTFLTNDSVADAAVGELDWEIDAISGGADTISYETANGETFMRMTGGGAGDGDGSGLSLKDDAVTVGSGGGFVRVRVRYPNITGNALAGNNFQIGLTDVHDSTEPVVGFWLDSDAGVMSFDSASANGDLTAAVTTATGGTQAGLTSGTTLVLGTTYNAELRWHGANTNADVGPKTLDCYIKGVHVGRINNSLLDGAETIEPAIVHWSDTGGAATLELDIFGFEAASFLAK